MGKSRIGTALKAFVNPQLYSEHYEKRFMTILSEFGFGQKDLKTVIEKGYLTNTYVYAIINRIAETASNIPLLIEAKLPNGDIEIITEGDFYNFVHNPNKEKNYRTFCYESMVYQLATGNVFQYGVKGVGFNNFMERWNLAPQYINPKVEYAITGAYATSYKYSIGGKTYSLDVEELSHLKKFNPDPNSENPVMGLSPLQSAYRTLSASNEIITADASLIKNRGAMGMLSSKGERPLTSTEREQTEESLRKRIGGGDKFGSIGVTSGEFDFIKFAMSPSDLQILESGVMKLRDLCAVYGASSRQFGDPNGTTYNNSKTDDTKFYTNAVLPPLEAELDNFNRFFTQGWNERDNVIYTVYTDTKDIEALQEDQAKLIVKSRTRSEIVTKIIAGITEKKWSRESAIRQLMDALDVKEEYATELIGNEIVEVAPIVLPNNLPNE